MILQVATPKQTTAFMEQRDEAVRTNAEQYKQPLIVDNLAGMVRNHWGIAKSTRQHVTTRLIDCLERRQGRYSGERLRAIKQTGGSAIYMQLTAAKCRAAKAYLSDLYSPSGDKPFAIKPTPIPDLPPEIRQKLMFEAMSVIRQTAVSEQDAMAIIERHRDRLMDEVMLEAEERAEKMGNVIEDMLIDAGWREQFKAFLDDLVTYPAAIMKGPVFTRKKRIKWVDVNQQFVPQRAMDIVPEVRRVSPFDMYPSPGIRDSFEGHWNIEHRRFTFEELSGMRGAPGYKAQAIEQVLEQHRASGLTEWIWSEDEHSRLTQGETGNIYGKRETIDALEWTGSVSGKMLMDWGMDPRSMPDQFEEYQVSVMVIGTVAVRALVNPDPAGKPDYFKACWETVPGSFWGKALPEVMADTQDMCNGVARALANNLGLASGPQVWVDTSQLSDGANIRDMYPWKIWPMKTNVNATGAKDPIGFFQPTSNARELLQVYERFSKYGDEVTGMPAFAYGSDQGAGAARTASGLSMLLNASGKTIKAVVHDIDLQIVEPMVEKFYNHIMMFHGDNSIKGDAMAHARGSEALIHKEAAQLRAQELLAITANPVDLNIIGDEGRRQLLEYTMKTGDIPADRVIPTKEELMQRNQAMQQLQQQQPMEQHESE